MKKLFVILLITLLCVRCQNFKCSFNQGPNQYNCWSLSLICEAELVFLTNPQSLQKREILLTNKEFERNRICQALNYSLHALKNQQKCKFENVFKGYQKTIVSDIMKVIDTNFQYPENGKEF